MGAKFAWLLQKAETMSTYERERAEHIQRNKERMMALQIPGLASHVGPQKEARPAKPKGITSKRQKPKVCLNSSVASIKVLAASVCIWYCSLSHTMWVPTRSPLCHAPGCT